MLRRAFRRVKTSPDGNVKAWKTGLINGRDIGRDRETVLGCDRVGLDRPGTDLRKRVAHLIEHEVYLASYQVPHCTSRPAGGHKLAARSGDRLKARTADVRSPSG